MRLVIALCSAEYSGKLSAQLPPAKRLVIVKGDGSVLIHSEGGSYKPLNWMSPPCSITETIPDSNVATDEEAASMVWQVTAQKSDDVLTIMFHEVLLDIQHDLGVDPGLIKEGVEAHLQELLAEQISLLGEGFRVVRREYMTPIGPVDILATDGDGKSVAIEIKRRGEIDGVEQLTRYLEFMNRDPLLAPVSGVFAAQEIRPQARALAEDRGIRCLTLDLDEMRGREIGDLRLF